MPSKVLPLAALLILLHFLIPFALTFTITTYTGNNLNKYSKNGSTFLSKKNPLWILDDAKSKTEREKFIYSTNKPYFQKRFPRREKLTANTYQKPQMLESGTVKMREMPMHRNKRLRLTHKSMRPHDIFTKLNSHNTASSHRVQKLPHQIKIPSHYLQLPVTEKITKDTTKRRQQQAYDKQHQKPPLETARSMPIFDSLPGDDVEVGSIPVFIYNSPRGQMLWNTMLSFEKYQMQEPVPGEVLYPPIAPMFRPKPIIENLRLTASSISETGRAMNITFIPFYAHEALGIPFTTKVEPQRIEELDYFLTSTTTTTTRRPATVIESTTLKPPNIFQVTSAPAAVYANSVFTTLPTGSPTKKRRSKKVKKYVAYHSPDEVHWEPMVPHLLASTTTPFPPTLMAPFPNHRFDTQATEDFTTPMPMPMENFEVTYEDDEDRLHILYVDDTTKKTTYRPKRIPVPLFSSRYARENSGRGKEYYALPVFTLGKLLKTNAARRLGQQFGGKRTTRRQFKRYRPVMKDEHKKDTWIILNSRYKGNPSSTSFASTNTNENTNNYERLSTKYMQQARRMLHETTASVATTATVEDSSSTSTTTAQMHAS